METVLAILLTIAYACMLIMLVCVTVIVFVLAFMAIKTFIEELL